MRWSKWAGVRTQEKGVMHENNTSSLAAVTSPAGALCGFSGSGNPGFKQLAVG
jgi:hypothetical protein